MKKSQKEPKFNTASLVVNGTPKATKVLRVATTTKRRTNRHGRGKKHVVKTEKAVTKVAAFICPKCHEDFPSTQARKDHRAEKHPAKNSETTQAATTPAAA
jgi:hypothetical protein